MDIIVRDPNTLIIKSKNATYSLIGPIIIALGFFAFLLALAAQEILGSLLVLILSAAVGAYIFLRMGNDLTKLDKAAGKAVFVTPAFPKWERKESPLSTIRKVVLRRETRFESRGRGVTGERYYKYSIVLAMDGGERSYYLGIIYAYVNDMLTPEGKKTEMAKVVADFLGLPLQQDFQGS